MRLHNTYKNSLLAIALVLFGGIAMAQGDLAISLTQSSTSPAQYTFYSVELTVQNEGSVSVADITVDVPMPAGVVYEGGNEFSSTGAAATFTAYGSNQGLLTVAELLPGESSVVTINYFLRVPSAPAQYAQVLTASEPDVDSTPGNGTPPTVNEDDEASTEINGGFVPDLTLANLALVQNTVDSGEQVDFTFDINNIGTGSIAQNFLVQAYISVDDQLSPDDLQNGTVPTGNFAAGQTVSGVVGASLPTGLAPGNYFLILEADANGQVLESNETNNTIFVPLTIEASTPTVCEVAIANSTITCDDNGTPQDPSDDIARIEILAMNAGGTSFTVTSSAGTQVAAGDYGVAVTFTLPLFNNQNSALEYVVLDDTAPATCSATVALTSPTTCSPNGPDLQVSALQLDPTGIQANGDLEFTFDLTNAGATGIAQTFLVQAFLSEDTVLSPDDIQNGTVPTGNFGPAQTVAGVVGASNTSALAPGDYYLILFADANRQVAETLENNNTSNAVPFTVPQPAGCEIAINNVLGITCSDNGTPSDPTDDQASVQLVVNNGSVVGAYDILDPSGSTIGGGVYGSTASMVIQNLQATQGATIQYTLVDRNDPTCTSQFPIITPVPCSNGGVGDIDLSVGITQSPGQPAQYTLYSVTATVSNSGAQSATGVVVDLPLPAGVVYEGGNEYSATQGDLRIFGSNVGTWTVGTIAAGQTAEITINYFLRVTSSPNSYIEVLAANEQDVDSTPGNGNGQVNEDDEASTDPTSGPTCSISASIQSIDCDDQGTATETDDTYSVTFLVENGAATGTWTADNGGANPSFGGSYGVPYTLQGGNLLNAINLGGLTLAVNITDDLDASCTTSLTWQTPGATCSSSTDPCDAVTEYRATPAAPFKVGVSDDEAGNFTVQYATPSGGLASFTFNVPSAIGISPVNLSTVSARDVICTSNGFAVAGLYRELGSPGNNQPYVILLDAAGAVTHSNVAPFAGTYNDINNLGFLDVATSGPAGDIVYVEAFTAGRSYQIAAFDASATLLWEGQRIGDLVTNRIEGAVLSDDESRIYFSYRDGNSITWPRLRGVNVTDGSTDWEVRLGDLTNLPLNEPVRGDVSAPFLTENDEVIVSFSASGLNSNVQRHAARFDAAGNLVYFTQQPDPASNSFDIYTPVFESSTGAVVFSGTPATVVLTASGEAVLCNNDQIDLELTAVSSTQQPQQYTTNSITFTLTNDGPSTATGILVDVIKPSEVVYTGGNEFTASQGTYAPRANPDVWDVGSLAAGESATLVVNYFVREAGGFLQRAEVSAADQVDVDSTPGNASGVLEDDEVILNLNFASTQALTFFPNPLPQGEQIILDFVSSGETSQTMIFSDLTGRPVHTVQVAFQEGRNRIPVDLGSLPSGIYVVAFPESGLAPKRIIVQE